MFLYTAVVAAFMLAALARPSFADVAGQASVIDGDTIVVAGELVRLEGIDAQRAAIKFLGCEPDYKQKAGNTQKSHPMPRLYDAVLESTQLPSEELTLC